MAVHVDRCGLVSAMLHSSPCSPLKTGAAPADGINLCGNTFHHPFLCHVEHRLLWARLEGASHNDKRLRLVEIVKALLKDKKVRLKACSPLPSITERSLS